MLQSFRCGNRQLLVSRLTGQVVVHRYPGESDDSRPHKTHLIDLLKEKPMPNAATIEALLDTMIANEQSRQLSESVEGLRDNENEFAASLVSYADSFAAEVRERVWHMIRQHPEAHSRILSLLRTVIQWVEKDRAELKSRNFPKSAPEMKELDQLEMLVRSMGRDILRYMAVPKHAAR